jgi:hypothetical protein
VFEKLLLIAIEVMGTTHQRIFRTALSWLFYQIIKICISLYNCLKTMVPTITVSSRVCSVSVLRKSLFRLPFPWSQQQQ